MQCETDVERWLPRPPHHPAAQSILSVVQCTCGRVEWWHVLPDRGAPNSQIPNFPNSTPKFKHKFTCLFTCLLSLQQARTLLVLAHPVLHHVSENAVAQLYSANSTFSVLGAAVMPVHQHNMFPSLGTLQQAPQPQAHPAPLLVSSWIHAGDGNQLICDSKG